MAGNFSFNDFFSQAFFLGYGVTIGCVLNVLTTRVVKREHEAVKRTEFLIKTLSHDVKNRLSIIKGCLSLICADYEDKKPEQKMKVGILDMESTKVSQIVNNLINCFSEEYINLNKKPESIHKIKEMIMSDWEQKFKLNSINFDFKLINISEQDSIDIDLNYIELAWNNILANSIQYNKPGSRVCLNIARQNGSVLFKFLSDNEIIPEEKREEIFNKYTDSKQHTFCSKGLGLYYVRFVSRLHGGNAWYGVEDESGKGMFILEFPFDAGE
ncbi:MAG: HAMP domain-containing histidine kinase [Oligoflexia bacterium]|nr:HAMP domain-containing histidine kinase [Oligoflexia bacterium]